eukprot:CAMPEP_0180458292 /NCGR_PEP_ID=MMETSP1036_2-20121128/22270_1 /TAXON_ID=632150 /ORGANISM="Azadinium spinosum, Strain 3D9" /LENGTH=240 /DNA_ID=CAMNT_0022464941 /DNA_START=11 /DNA_END=731 /DNA_ORIENTATION=-
MPGCEATLEVVFSQLGHRLQAQGSGHHRQDELATVPLTLGVIVEEIGVEHRLHKAPSPADPIDVVVHEVAVYPIQDVERAVRPHRAHKVRREILDLADLLQEYQLWYDRHALQPNRCGPKYLRNVVLVCAQEPQDSTRPQEVDLVLEAVVAPLVRRRDGRLDTHEVDEIDCGGDEYYLHHGVVDRDEAPHQVHVSEDEHQSVDLLMRQDTPAQLLFLCNLKSSNMMLVKWSMSPLSRKRF